MVHGFSNPSYHEHGRRGTKTAVRDIAATFRRSHAANDGLGTESAAYMNGGGGKDTSLASRFLETSQSGFEMV